MFICGRGFVLIAPFFKNKNSFKMEKIKFMPEVDQATRMRILQQNADRIEETDYLRPLTESEIDAKREELTENSIRLSQLADDKQAAMEEFKAKMDPLQKANKGLLTELKTRQVKEFGHLYHVANHDNGMMETFDHQGELLYSRRLRPNEGTNIFAMTKTGTNE